MPASGAPESGIPDYDHLEPPYDHEWGGARGLVEAAEVLDQAEALIARQRFLQQESFLLKENEEQKASHGFEVGRRARKQLRVRDHLRVDFQSDDQLPIVLFAFDDVTRGDLYTAGSSGNCAASSSTWHTRKSVSSSQRRVST